MIALVALALADEPAVQGFAELRGSWAVGTDGTPWTLVERFRPTFDAPLSERIRLSTTVEAGLAQGRHTATELQRTLEESDVGPLLELAGCEWPEDDNPVFHTNDSGDYLFVDRLYVDFYHPKFDLRVGRQALQWGSAMFVNFTDPYPQVLFTEPWRPRAGVNAARITVPFGDLNQLSAVVGADDDFTAPRLAARGTVNWQQTDWSLIAAWRQESDELLTGVDIKGTLGVGFWVESAVHFRDLSTDPTVNADIAVGVDYSVPVLQTLYFAAQYLHNGTTTDATAVSSLGAIAGPECDSPTPFDGASAEADPFAPFLSNQHYGLVVANLGVTKTVAVNAAWLQSFSDGTGFLVPSMSLRLPKGFDVSLTGQIPVRTWGDGGEFQPAEEDLVLAVPDTDLTVDFSGLVPAANVFLWTRFNF